jgi:hypothetical protein
MVVLFPSFQLVKTGRSSEQAKVKASRRGLGPHAADFLCDRTGWRCDWSGIGGSRNDVGTQEGEVAFSKQARIKDLALLLYSTGTYYLAGVLKVSRGREMLEVSTTSPWQAISRTCTIYKSTKAIRMAACIHCRRAFMHFRKTQLVPLPSRLLTLLLVSLPHSFVKIP